MTADTAFPSPLKKRNMNLEPAQDAKRSIQEKTNPPQSPSTKKKKEKGKMFKKNFAAETHPNHYLYSTLFPTRPTHHLHRRGA